jgi:hypothetical protein
VGALAQGVQLGVQPARRSRRARTAVRRGPSRPRWICGGDGLQRRARVVAGDAPVPRGVRVALKDLAGHDGHVLGVALAQLLSLQIVVAAVRSFGRAFVRSPSQRKQRFVDSGSPSLLRTMKRFLGDAPGELRSAGSRGGGT